MPVTQQAIEQVLSRSFSPHVKTAWFLLNHSPKALPHAILGGVQRWVWACRGKSSCWHCSTAAANHAWLSLEQGLQPFKRCSGSLETWHVLRQHSLTWCSDSLNRQLSSGKTLQSIWNNPVGLTGSMSEEMTRDQCECRQHTGKSRAYGRG